MGFSAPKVPNIPASPMPPSIAQGIAFNRPKVGPASADGVLGGTFMTGDATSTGAGSDAKKALTGQ